MRSNIRAIRAAAYSAVWAIAPEKLEAVLEFLDLRADGRTLNQAQLRALGIKGESNRMAVRPNGQIAVLPLRGVIAHHAGMEMQISGGTSTVGFGRAFDEAMANADITAIVIDCDSPGGTVEGVPELFAKIFAARGKGKQISAVVNAHMHSAAYWIGCAADEIVVTPSGAVGDIGVMTIHTDTSAMEAKVGIKRTLIKAGKYKGEGAPFEPLSDAALAATEQRVDAIYALFTRDVARGRSTSPADVEGGYGEGRSVGAQDAVDVGLADRVATFEQVIAELGGSNARSASRLAAARRAPAIRADVMQDAEIEECPDCGAPMELNDAETEYVCPECGATAPVPADDAADDARAAASVTGNTPMLAAAVIRAIPGAGATRTITAAAASPKTIPPVAGATGTGSGLPSEPTAVQATRQENTTVPDPVIAAPDREAMLAEVRAAEAARVRDINALCADHGMTLRASEFIASTMDVNAVARAILAEKKTASAANPAIRVGADRAADRPFASLGEQLMAIAAHFGGIPGMSPEDADKRLYAGVISGGAQAGVGSDGGFAIQKEFATELLETTIDGGDLLGQTDSHEVGADADGLEVLYLDETSRATGSRWGGVQVYRAAEGDSATAKKPKFGKWESRLEDIIGIAYMTERLLKDASSIQNVFSNGFMAEFRFVAENELVRGTGSGQMYGILNAPVTVSVAKETSQDADSLVAENIGKMWKCVHPRSRLKGAWYYNVELEDQLDRLQIGTGTSAQLVFMPPGGLSGKPYGTIKGRPTIPIEYASGAGDVGDFFFADWSRYKVITKGGLQADDSIHVRFTTNERAFRWITRINGAPKDKSAITPFKATDSTLKLSPFVTLAAR